MELIIRTKVESDLFSGLSTVVKRPCDIDVKFKVCPGCNNRFFLAGKKTYDSKGCCCEICKRDFNDQGLAWEVRADLQELLGTILRGIIR